SKELVQLLAGRLHVLVAAVDGLDAREPSDALVTIRPGQAANPVECVPFVQELAGMYAGWADARGMRLHRDGISARVVLQIAGLGAYTLLKGEAGLHVLELPHDEDRGFDRLTALVEVGSGGSEDAPAADRGEPAVVRRYRHEP